MKSSVAETFRDGTVFVTGSTGFLGKLLMEKLLRSCPVKNVAILVRSKKGFTASQRVEDIYKQPLFDRLREENPDFMKRIIIIDGNIEKSKMGLSSTDHDWLIENVNFVFHCAATIKFNEPLAVATQINIQGTQILLSLATEMKNLKGFVHVSTAYSHCPRDEIKEQLYLTPITAKELKERLHHDADDSTTNNILENWPNTYTFTKAITENMIATNGNHLPISIFRPSIIGCTQSEPNPGWLENMNGPSGIITGIMVGFLRTVLIASDKVTNIIPADYTVNALISVMWDTVNCHRDTDSRTNEQPKIYNYVSSDSNPLTWDRYIQEMRQCYYEAPPLQSMWYGFCLFYTNMWFGMILRFLLHRVPAALVDLLLILSGKKSKMLKMYAKTERMMDMLSTFSTRQWKFDNSNTKKLWSSLSEEDRQTFWYNLEEFKWSPYIKSFYYGIRKHILHEDVNNMKEALAKNRKLFWLHRLSIFLGIYLLLQIYLIFSKY